MSDFEELELFDNGNNGRDAWWWVSRIGCLMLFITCAMIGALVLYTPSLRASSIRPTFTFSTATPFELRTSTLLPLPTFIAGTPVPPTATPDLNAILEQKLAELDEGRMLFNPPQEMRQGDQERVELRVVHLQEGVSEPAVKATLESGLLGVGVPTVEPLKVGTFMKAKLSGEGFNIVPLNDEESQIVAGESFTQWAWDIRAEESGPQNLNLTVKVIVFVSQLGEKGQDLPVITKSVLVEVNPVYSIGEFISEHPEFVIGTAITVVLAPFVGWAIKRYRARRAEARSKKRQAGFRQR